MWVEPEGQKLEALVYDKPEHRDRGDADASRSIIHYRFANDVVLKLGSTDKRLGGGARFIGEKGEITIFRGTATSALRRDSIRSRCPAEALRYGQRQSHAELLRLRRLAQGSDHERRGGPSSRHACVIWATSPAGWVDACEWDPRRKCSPLTTRPTSISIRPNAQRTHCPLRYRSCSTLFLLAAWQCLRRCPTLPRSASKVRLSQLQVPSSSTRPSQRHWSANPHVLPSGKY